MCVLALPDLALPSTVNNGGTFKGSLTILKEIFVAFVIPARFLTLACISH